MNISSSRRSLLNFTVLVIFSLVVTILILDQAHKAITEIEALQTTPVYLGLKNLEK